MLNRVFALALVAGLFAGCGKKDPAASSGAVSPLQIWKVGNAAEPQDLDPQVTTGDAEHKIHMALFEGLASKDPKDLHPVPAVAKSWDISDDGLVYTFHLRENTRWSDGGPLTAEDFVHSYRRMLSPALGAEFAYLLWSMVGAEDFNKGKLKDFAEVGVKAVDDRTLRITLRQPTPFFLKMVANHSAWMPVPTRVIAKIGPVDSKNTRWTKPGQLVGNGPFLLREWLPNQKIVVVRNPHYWDAGTVKLDEIHFFATENQAAEERMFRTGQLHATYDLPFGKIDTYRKDYPGSLKIDPLLAVYYYYCNVQKPPLNDKRVRKALALAIDRESLVKNVTRGGQQPAYAVSYPGSSGYFPKARLTGDLDEARRLLAEAGYPGGKGCPVIEILFNTHDNHRLLAEAIQAMWRTELGVDVRLVNQEWKVYLDMTHTRDYMVARAGWIADYLDPHPFLELWATDNENNRTGWSNPEYDRLLKESLKAGNDVERYETYQKLDAILVNELPVIPIYYYTRVHAISPKVKGYYPTLLDHHPYKHIYLEE